MADVSRETPPAPLSVRGVFGDRLPLMTRYASWLAEVGTVRGVIGPNEVPRLWRRHLVNCAVVTELIPAGQTVCDVGSGAGLPGVVIAIMRPDLSVTLVEPLQRRVEFLEQVVSNLKLSNVEVVRAKAEALHGRRTFDIVTARAVAPLPELAPRCLPLVRTGGKLLAMKGSGAIAEVTQAGFGIKKLGGVVAGIRVVGPDEESTATVVEIAKVSR